MHRSKQHLFSTTSSAQASRVAGPMRRRTRHAARHSNSASIGAGLTIGVFSPHSLAYQTAGANARTAQSKHASPAAALAAGAIDLAKLACINTTRTGVHCLVRRLGRKRLAPANLS